jgi:hypothetical protein
MKDTMKLTGYHEVWANGREAKNETYARFYWGK